MTVKDIIAANDKDIEIIIEGKNALDDCDGFTEFYYEGKLGDVPEAYYSCIVLRHGYSLGYDCPFIAIPFLKQNDLVDPDYLEIADQSELLDVEKSEHHNIVLKYSVQYFNRDDQLCILTFSSLESAEDFAYNLVYSGETRGFNITVYNCDNIVDYFPHLGCDPETYREAVRRYADTDLETADQGEPEYDETSEQDNTVESRTCESCLYRDYVEPDRCDETFHFTCLCKSSPLFYKVNFCSNTCDFYIPIDKYQSLLSSAPSG